jgi:cytochrome c-type biogenesis protein CcmE
MSSSKKKSLKWVIGGTVIVGAIVAMSFLTLNDNLVYFFTPSEAFAKAADLDGQVIKVGGMVKGGSVQWKPETLSLNFVLSDLKGYEIAVSHTGTPPDMFKENQGVVVEGRLTEGGKAMISRNLMVKHSEEYKKPGAEHGSMDKELLERSLFKGQEELKAKGQGAANSGSAP